MVIFPKDCSKQRSRLGIIPKANPPASRFGESRKPESQHFQGFQAESALWHTSCEGVLTRETIPSDKQNRL